MAHTIIFASFGILSYLAALYAFWRGIKKAESQRPRQAYAMLILFVVLCVACGFFFTLI